MAMTDKAIELDEHRGMAAQKATDLRRLLADVEANERALRERQDELEAHLIAAPAANWPEAAEKARYLLNLFAAKCPSEDFLSPLNHLDSMEPILIRGRGLHCGRTRTGRSTTAIT
jgi:hypothetical protein